MLTAAERECIRAVGDTEKVTGHEQATVKTVIRLGLVWYDHEEGSYHLTEKGVKRYRRIMESGDGPEALKDMFGPRR